MLNFGMNYLWPTPVLRLNLLEMGAIDPNHHAWLKNYADRPELVSAGAEAFGDREKFFTRYNYEPFDQAIEPELRQFKEMMLSLCDSYAKSTLIDTLPDHVKKTYMWFVIQHSGNVKEAVDPHCHEGSDVSFCYYLEVPKDESGQVCFIDPRGCVGRGGFVIPRASSIERHQPTEGDLLMFPRYANHYTTPNMDTLNRKVIAGSVAYNRGS